MTVVRIRFWTIRVTTRSTAARMKTTVVKVVAIVRTTNRGVRGPLLGSYRQGELNF